MIAWPVLNSGLIPDITYDYLSIARESIFSTESEMPLESFWVLSKSPFK